VRRIGVVTVGRSDWGIYLPVLRAMQASAALEPVIYASGAHLSPEFGRTVEMIEADGFRVAERVEMLLSSDSPEGIAKSMGLGTLGFAQVFGRQRPDLLLVLGDRFEMHAAALAALPFTLPVAHLHGGELTAGAIDDALRHSLTKLSHLHFVATEEYARRVLQLGEEPWRVLVTGAPALDSVRRMPRLGEDELERRFGVRVDARTLLVTFHPVTLEFGATAWQVEELLAALRTLGAPVVFTAPNADTSGRTVRRAFEEFVRRQPGAALVENFGTEGYFSAMARAGAMVGNSSSGIVEAASFALPVVNIGTRQQGRVRGENVLDVEYGRDAIVAGVRRALSPDFRAGLAGLVNPYGDGHAAEAIVRRLEDVTLDAALVTKRFVDASSTVGSSH